MIVAARVLAKWGIDSISNTMFNVNEYMPAKMIQFIKIRKPLASFIKGLFIGVTTDFTLDHIFNRLWPFLEWRKDFAKCYKLSLSNM